MAPIKALCTEKVPLGKVFWSHGYKRALLEVVQNTSDPTACEKWLECAPTMIGETAMSPPPLMVMVSIL